MKNFVSWLALCLSTVAIVVSFWPEKSINAERVILKDKNGVIRTSLTADDGISLFSEEGKELLYITTITNAKGIAEGVQLTLRGSDGRERIRLSTWNGNYIWILDNDWNKRLILGDSYIAKGDGYVKKMGISFDKDGKQEMEMFLDISK